MRKRTPRQNDELKNRPFEPHPPSPALARRCSPLSPAVRAIMSAAHNIGTAPVHRKRIPPPSVARPPRSRAQRPPHNASHPVQAQPIAAWALDTRGTISRMRAEHNAVRQPPACWPASSGKETSAPATVPSRSAARSAWSRGSRCQADLVTRRVVYDSMCVDE